MSHQTISISELKTEELIGKGKSGEVWKGVWNGAGGGVTVAIKKLNLQNNENNSSAEADFQELLQELDILSKLRHQVILNVYGKAIVEKELWVVLEYADGGNLHDYLHGREPINWPTRLGLALQAARAVNYLHSLRPAIIHRDIKSLNFLISKKSSLELKLSDFGMAKMKTSSDSSDNDSCGTTRWQAPEVMVDNNFEWTEKCDIYSLGMVFYELCSRDIPFSQIADNAQVISHVKYAKERPTIPPDCPVEFSEIIAKCWDHDPTMRPSSHDLVSLLQLAIDSFSNSSQTSSLFFQINQDLLLKSLPADCVETLSSPPPFPSPRESPPIPSEVKIIKLKKINSNPLVSKSYDAQLFERVEVYFRRFFNLENPSLVVQLDEVHVVLNSEVEKRFKEAEEKLHEELKGIQDLKGEEQNELQKYYLSHLLNSNNLIDKRNSNPISAWHGARERNTESICWYGMLNMTATDPGYYGKAMYFTQHPKYGEYYAQACKKRTKENENGSFQLFLCWVLLGKPFATTQVKMGADCESGYSSHFSVITEKKLTEDLCFSARDFETLGGVTNYFPVREREPVSGDEIGIFNSAHVLPRFIVKYSILPRANSFVNSPSGISPTFVRPDTTREDLAATTTPQQTPETAATPTPSAGPPPDYNMELLMAAKECSLEGVKKALAGGADVNTVAQTKTALALVYLKHFSKKAREDVVKELLVNGADPNVTDGNSTILHLAIYRNDADSVKALLEKGAKIDENDYRGESPFKAAVLNSNSDNNIIQILLDHGANVEEEISPGISAFLHCLKLGKVEMGKVLIQNKAKLVRVAKQDREISSTCSKCDKKFTVLKRRQSCYSCGRSYCSDCMTKAELSSYDRKKQTCNDCLQIYAK